MIAPTVGQAMNRLEKGQSRERWRQARKLWNDWDPIGVFSIDSSWPLDEYESYVGPTLRLLERGASQNELASYFSKIAGDHMGLSAFPDPHSFAERAKCWYEQDWPDSFV